MNNYNVIDMPKHKPTGIKAVIGEIKAIAGTCLEAQVIWNHRENTIRAHIHTANNWTNPGNPDCITVLRTDNRYNDIYTQANIMAIIRDTVREYNRVPNFLTLAEA